MHACGHLNLLATALLICHTVLWNSGSTISRLEQVLLELGELGELLPLLPLLLSLLVPVSLAASDELSWPAQGRAAAAAAAGCGILLTVPAGRCAVGG